MVSIIVPVYNVEQYIDRCLESVVKQTCSDIEILVMEAKSADKSLDRVLAWAKNDDRFTVVSRRDGGLGPARNYALKIARGEFVVFLDSDDWLELDFVEKTLQAVRQDPEIDIVMTGFYRHMNSETRTYKEALKDGIYDDVEIKKRIMVYGNTPMWSKLFRRELFLSNRIEQPALPLEDLAVYPALIAAARKIAVCNSAFVHYQASRPGSLSESISNLYLFPKVMEYSEGLLRRDPLCGRYFPAVYWWMYRKLCGTYAYLQSLKDDLAEIECFDARYRDMGTMVKPPYVVCGGFPSRWTVHRMLNGKERLRKHFAFTGLISQMSGGSARWDRRITHENVFRELCISQDVQKDLAGELREDSESQDNTIYVFDFLDECQDVARLSESCYITLSEALEEIMPECRKIYPVISWDSEQYWSLWKLSCEKLAGLLCEHIDPKRVVLFQYYLAGRYKEAGRLIPYETQEDIRRKNRLLRRMYGYFLERMPEIRTYRVSDELLYTDVTDQEWDAQPDYLNSFAYDSMYQRLEIDLVEERYGGLAE